MTKKKLMIYGSVLSVLSIAFLLCLSSMKDVYRANTEQHISDSMAMIERQLENNIRIESKNLLLLVNQFSLSSQQDLQGLLSAVEKIPKSSTSHHIFDSQGVFHSVNNEAISTKIDPKALQLAYSNGYYVASVTKEKSSQKFVCLFSPLIVARLSRQKFQKNK